MIYAIDLLPMRRRHCPIITVKLLVQLAISRPVRTELFFYNFPTFFTMALKILYFFLSNFLGQGWATCGSLCFKIILTTRWPHSFMFFINFSLDYFFFLFQLLFNFGKFIAMIVPFVSVCLLPFLFLLQLKNSISNYQHSILNVGLYSQ